ncbi:hypothetical protein Golax_003875, partial [Gossypium laxum]|nr:hypothetical protein [Gossypium laxum]
MPNLVIQSTSVFINDVALHAEDVSNKRWLLDEKYHDIGTMLNVSLQVGLNPQL